MWSLLFLNREKQRTQLLPLNSPSQKEQSFSEFVMWWAHLFHVLPTLVLTRTRGPEIGVASTKAFTAQLTVLNMIALIVAQKKGTITEQKFHEMLVEMENIPAKVEKAPKT